MSDDQGEKTEEPSQYKLDEAKKKGSVSKSMDLNSFLILGAVLVLTMASGQQLAARLFELCRKIFVSSGQMNFGLDHLAYWFVSIMKEGLYIISPMLIVIMIVGVLSTVLQTGFVFSFTSLKPDIKKLNPIEGFKKLFSLRLVFEAVKSFIKLGLFSTIVYFSIIAILPNLFGLLSISPFVYFSVFLKYTITILFKLLAALALIALIDFMFVRWEFLKKMRMSKHEVKEEHKKRDGDPHVKAKRKELQNELRKRSAAVSNVPNADVVVTNPTHLAVLLKYDRQKMLAPVVIGKASGDLVQHIKEVARLHRVPVIEQKILARVLYRKAKIDGAIPAESFVDVARVFRKAYQQTGRLPGMVKA